MSMSCLFFAASLLAGLGASAGEVDLDKPIYQFTMNTIEEQSLPLLTYKGKVLMVVNVASYCGLTPQYESLQAIHEKFKDRGLIVLGFPANQFNNQEPGSNEEIKEFCTQKYGVSFPMFSKIVVKGEGIHPLYQWLIGKADRKDIEWNFAKFIVSRDGTKAWRFPSRTKPDAPEVLKVIEQQLG